MSLVFGLGDFALLCGHRIVVIYSSSLTDCSFVICQSSVGDADACILHDACAVGLAGLGLDHVVIVMCVVTLVGTHLQHT